ncbi:porin [Variovorax sp. JS1663]|uniref:porin n=1 Tax=Variovorax sp. JS1663 TaxID=1851577 RepID=UPI000B34449B|nr:porin [Variovorax sp. JS1663]OUM04069.1 porin [Variovorax sp. JS1663]
MKKKIVSLAAMTVAGAASAQTSVTVFGVVDAAVSGFSSRSEDARGARGSVKVSRTALTNGAYNSSRLGFRGTEDLGGGLAAGFWLEAPISNDDGQTGIASFSRRSTLSLSGGFGEIRVGRDYTPIFFNDAVFDPFGAVGTGTNLLFTANTSNPTGGAGGFGGSTSYNRASNSIGYFLPPGLGGFYGQAMYAFHEQDKYTPGSLTPTAANNSRAGRHVGARFGYASGPVDAALAYGNATTGDQFFAGTTDTVKTLSFGASYDFGPAKLHGEVARSSFQRDADVPPPVPFNDTKLHGYLLGVTVPVGVGLIRASYARVEYDRLFRATPTSGGDPRASKVALGYVHNLSKRTALYATLARISNKNGAALTIGGPAFIRTSPFTPRASTGYDLGIRHAF